MIKTLTSSLPTFKKLSFQPGLNILLADKSPGATHLQTRNRAGKTSVVETIHFVLGADVRKKGLFKAPELAEHDFGLVFDLGESCVLAERRPATPSKILVQPYREPKPEDDVANFWGAPPRISNDQWCARLGAEWFGLPGMPPKEGLKPPSFRSLFAYFARRQNDGGFTAPTLSGIKQQIGDQQLALSYLLGLDWELAAQFQRLRKQETMAKHLRAAAKKGDLGPAFARASDLRTQLTIAEAHLEQLRSDLASFRVVPRYAEYESEANALTRAIAQHNNDNLIDRLALDELREATRLEAAPGDEKVLKLYEEAKVVLPQVVRAHFAEVARFHDAVLANRRSHLAAEILATEARIAERDGKVAELDKRRAEVMAILQSGQALEQYTLLREELGRTEAQVQTLAERLTLAESLERTKRDIDGERNRLAKALADDVHERRTVVGDAILTFERLSESLYEKAGSLTIADSLTGPSFEVHIEGERSKGIGNMQIFCFDLMLMVLGAKRGRTPGFLIHDSHLFDGVDERQTAKALQLGAKYAQEHGFQYIVTMNSDALPKEGFGKGFDLNQYVLPVRLTDATESGGLFGFRFG